MLRDVGGVGGIRFGLVGNGPNDVVGTVYEMGL